MIQVQLMRVEFDLIKYPSQQILAPVFFCARIYKPLGENKNKNKKRKCDEYTKFAGFSYSLIEAQFTFWRVHQFNWSQVSSISLVVIHSMTILSNVHPQIVQMVVIWQLFFVSDKIVYQKNLNAYLWRQWTFWTSKYW